MGWACFYQAGMVEHAWNFSTGDAEAGQSELQKETLFLLRKNITNYAGACVSVCVCQSEWGDWRRYQDAKKQNNECSQC